MAAENPFDALHAGLHDCFKSSKYSDATIICGEQEFKVHQLVLCSQSKYFCKIFDGDWKESINSTIDLEEDEVSVAEAMLNFMYRFDYEVGSSDQSPMSPLIFHVKVYSIADKYDVPMLKSLARGKFEKAVKTCWDMDDLPHAITEIYSSTPRTDRGLRELVVETVCKHKDTLMEKQDFQNVLEETVGFAADVSRYLASGNVLPKANGRYNCPNCGKVVEAAFSPGSHHYYCIHCGGRRSNWEQCRSQS